jgi:hypothetical protein
MKTCVRRDAQFSRRTAFVNSAVVKTLPADPADACLVARGATSLPTYRHPMLHE